MLASLERRTSSTATRPLTYAVWFVDGALLFFATSWLGTTALTLDNDLYYAVYFWVALTFIGTFVRLTGIGLAGLFRRHMHLSWLLGLAASIYAVAKVLSADATARPGGLLLIFEVLWRGVAYGAVDSVVLTGFPVLVALGVFGGRVDRVRERIGFMALSLVLVWAMTAAYHLGFEQFDEGDLWEPEVNATVLSMPTIVTANPAASMMAQVSLHVAATVRTYESPVLVPPHVEHVPRYEPPGVFGQ